jgi:hypothetical protein
LRAIFDDARERINHFFHHDDWAGSPLGYLAMRVVHEAYPALSNEEVRILTLAIERRVQSESRARTFGTYIATNI